MVMAYHCTMKSTGAYLCIVRYLHQGCFLCGDDLHLFNPIDNSHPQVSVTTTIDTTEGPSVIGEYRNSLLNL